MKGLIHYRRLEFYVTHGMVVENIHEIISFKQSRWLEKGMKLITQKKLNKERFRKGFILNMEFLIHFMEKQWKMYAIV